MRILYLAYSSIGVCNWEGDLSFPILRDTFKLLLPGSGAGGPASIRDLNVQNNNILEYSIWLFQLNKSIA